MIKSNLIFIILLVFSSGCSTTTKNDSCESQKRNPSALEIYQKPPDPIVTVSGNFFYSDTSGSVIDPELYKKNLKAREPLRNYLDQILKMTELARKGDLDASRTVNQWLIAWANVNAMTKVNSAQGGFERKWLLSGLLIAYLANKPYQKWEQREKIENWFDQLTRLMMQDYQGYKKGSQRNNHVYWAGLVAIEMSLVNENKELLDWGLEKVRFGLSQIDEEGFLPLELERKGRALQYHRVSLEALMMSAYLLKGKGIDLSTEYNGALDKLATITFRGYQHPEIFEAKTGAKQEFQLKESTAWLVIYDRLKPGLSEVSNILKTAPPIWTRALGGKPIDFLGQSTGTPRRCKNVF